MMVVRSGTHESPIYACMMTPWTGVLAAAAMAVTLVSLPRAVGADAQAGAADLPGRAPRAEAAQPVPMTWYAGPADDRADLDRWRRAVGPPLLVAAPRSAAAAPPPRLDELVVVTWNAHLAEGDLHGLIAALRGGQLTAGRPVSHFVLLLQELHRRGADVPAFAPDARSAHAIVARDPEAPDAGDYARTLGLSLLYVPSMRNGPLVAEDRGNAIVSTEPLGEAAALELPFERQRRVAVGATVRVTADGAVRRLTVLNAHLEPLSSPASLWIFRNPRRRQAAALVEFLRAARAEGDPRSAGTVLGGDFNTIQGGAEEDAYVQARTWSHSLVTEDRRATHYMGRIDYLFFRLAPGWTASTTRVDDRFGSDHHPVLGRFAPPPARR